MFEVPGDGLWPGVQALPGYDLPQFDDQTDSRVRDGPGGIQVSRQSSPSMEQRPDKPIPPCAVTCT